MKQVNSKNRIKRMQRVSQMLNLRLQGASLQQITDAQDPPITFQAVSKAIRTTLRDIMIEPQAPNGLQPRRARHRRGCHQIDLLWRQGEQLYP